MLGHPLILRVALLRPVEAALHADLHLVGMPVDVGLFLDEGLDSFEKLDDDTILHLLVRACSLVGGDLALFHEVVAEQGAAERSLDVLGVAE